MYRRHLTADFVRSILDYDPETGIFRWRYRTDRAKNWNSRWAGKIAGHANCHGYIVIIVDGRRGPYQASRLAWLVSYGEWPPDQVDHINLVRNDNRLSNLRAATNSRNSLNRGPQRNNKSSGLRGVSLHIDGRWRVRITIDGKTHEIGLFRTKEEAAAARDAAAKRLLGEYATLSNSPVTRYEKHRSVSSISRRCRSVAGTMDAYS